MSVKTYSLRVWPNGEFGIGIVRKYEEPSLVKGGHPDALPTISWTPTDILSFIGAMAARGYSSEYILSCIPEHQRECLRRSLPLGSSDATKTHKRAERGNRGLTSYGRRMLRNACYLLEKRASKHRIAMVTTTIPACSPEVEKEITREWSEIVRTFTQFLSRRLRVAHSCPWVIGCVEIQEKRLQKFGGMPLHLHLVFQSKVGREYILGKSDVLDAWKRAVCERVPSAESLYWGASTRIEKVRKSVTNYMCKYMSKGINQSALVSVQNGYTLPSSWWIAVGGIKRVIKSQQIYSTGELASYVWEIAKESPSLFTWLFYIDVSNGVRSFCVGLTGQMSSALRAQIDKASRACSGGSKEISYAPKPVLACDLLTRVLKCCVRA